MAISGQGLIGFMAERPLRSQMSQGQAPFRATLVTFSPDRFFNGGVDLRDREGLAGHLVERPGVDQELVPKQGLQLSAVHLGNENMIIAFE